MAITMVKCRARVDFGGLSTYTPFVQSFNVKKQRGQAGTFDATLKVPSGSFTTANSGPVRIFAGEGSASKQIFTGYCTMCKISPCHDDPHYVIVSISGSDALSFLQGKKFTRRSRGTEVSWCSITGVIRKGLKSGKFAYNTEPIIDINDGNMERANNLCGYSSKNIIDGMPKPSTAPGGINDIPVILVVENLNAESGGEGSD